MFMESVHGFESTVRREETSTFLLLTYSINQYFVGLRRLAMLQEPESFIFVCVSALRQRMTFTTLSIFVFCCYELRCIFEPLLC